jgi:hypothetical protein
MLYKLEFQETIKRLKRKEKELEAVIDRKAKKRKKKGVKNGTIRGNDR